MITRKTGNLLDDPADALVNPVNCVGVMGAGLALQFKQRWPKYFNHYRMLCNKSILAPGRVAITGRHAPDQAPWIVSFPTKTHYSVLSRPALIQQSFDALSGAIGETDIASIAFPKVGCGLGMLSWADIEPMLLEFAGKLPDIEVILYT